MERVRIVLAAALAAAATVGVTADRAGAADPPEVIASGLDSPRHLAFSPNGDLYVVESGSGGDTGPDGNCVDHPLGLFCLGFTGAVTRVSETGPEVEVLSGLPSIAVPGEAIGPSDITFTGNKKFALSIGIGGSDEFRDAFGSDGAQLGTLVTGKLGTGTWDVFADVLANEATANPEPVDVDSNPVGFLQKGSKYVIADAGGNAIVEANHKGQFSTLAVLPGVPSSFGFDADAVPTSVVEGPDHAYYVSQLVGFPFDAGASSIWRIGRKGDLTVYASGLTNVTDLAFDDDGSLYAVEIASEGLQSGPVGALVRVTPGADEHEVVAGSLFAPYGLALRGDHAYVTTGSVLTGGGEVVKIDLG